MKIEKPTTLTIDQNHKLEELAVLCGVGINCVNPKTNTSQHFVLEDNLVKVDFADNGTSYVLTLYNVLTKEYKEELFNCTFAFHAGYTRFIPHDTVNFDTVMEFIETLIVANPISGQHSLNRAIENVSRAS